METFQDQKVIAAFQSENLNGKEVMDFLACLHKRGEDMIILRSWQEYFERKGTSWILTEKDTAEGKRLVLWKEREA